MVSLPFDVGWLLAIHAMRMTSSTDDCWKGCAKAVQTRLGLTLHSALARRTESDHKTLSEISRAAVHGRISARAWARVTISVGFISGPHIFNLRIAHGRLRGFGGEG